MKTQPLGPFLGENNRLPDFSLHVNKVGDFLRSTLNVDIDNKGNVRRRSATKLIQNLTGAHSIHTLTATTGYVMQDAVLYPFSVAGETVTLGTFLKVLSNADPVSWVESGPDLYYSNGTDSGRITAGVWYPLGIATPALPALSLTTGTLLAGWYQVGVSFSNSATGEESGISASSNIELTAVGGIHVILPTMATGADKINVYLSAANGSVVYLLATVATATYDCTTLAAGRESNGRFEDPLPAGTLFMSNGRLCSFSGNTVYVGSTWRHGYHLPAESYISFPAPVSIAIENQGGTYVVAGKTHFFPGSDLGNVEAMVNDVLPYGAVPGTAFEFPDKSFVGWFGEKGVVFASTSGEVVPATAEHMDVVVQPSGNSAVFESGGYRRVVSCGYCVNLESKALTTYSDWLFTSISGGYGTKADGIYLLDTTGKVNASVGFGKQDFGTEALKHFPVMYIGVASENQMELTVAYVDERDEEQAYDYLTRGYSAALKEQRFDLGKGVRTNWIDMTLRNTEGMDFTLASVSPAPTASTRRI